MEFHRRFDVRVDRKEAEQRFVNRARNILFDTVIDDRFRGDEYGDLARYVASVLGDVYIGGAIESEYVNGDFLRCLQAIEAIYAYAGEDTNATEIKSEIDSALTWLFQQSEVDLGVSWKEGTFLRTGAPLLDEALINDPLKWLRDTNLPSVLAPFQKAIGHFLQAKEHPEQLSDVITDMYEALEALAREVTGNNKDLSGNQDLLLKALRLSEGFKGILKKYIEYANNFRHAVRLGTEKPSLTESETESFMYLTGAFIRLAASTRSPL